MDQVGLKKTLQQQDGLYATFQDDSLCDFVNALKLTEERTEKHGKANWDRVASLECKLKISQICCHHQKDPGSILGSTRGLPV